MGERIVYSTLYALDGSTAEQHQPLLEMAQLWVAHLRGPARFDGRVVLLTNLPELQVADVEAIATPFSGADRQTLFLERVRRFRHVPVGPRDQVMQMDLDALAVAPLDSLFAETRPGELCAALSSLPPLDHDQAGGLLTRSERWRYRIRGWEWRRGVSACVTCCDGASWTPLMRRWAAAIRGRGRGRPMPLLGDQSFLNFLFLTGAARVRRLPGHLVHHVRQAELPLPDPAAVRAAVLHFPMPQKLEEMHRRSRVNR